MPRTTKSQWDFGELFPPAEARRVFTVTELTGQVKRLLETQLGRLWVSGEVSNLRMQASGHFYFTLKDAGAQLNCVLFRGEKGARRELLEDGRRVLLHGDLTVYEPRGQYQLVVDTVELQGVGALQLAFEQLKRKLGDEGLFAPERKRPIPRHPRRIGVVTSPTGAALQDVLHVLERRHPALELVLAPARVQGEGAAGEIAGAIGRLNEWSSTQPPGAGLDAILVTRGGGSLEDLWAFNEEIVARAIFASALPVVSAVGHEIDFTIADFVADLRAATPSAAAEILSEGAVAARQFVRESRERLRQWAVRCLGTAVRTFEDLLARLGRAHPRRRLNEHWQRLDDLLGAMLRAARYGLRTGRSRWELVWGGWQRVAPGRAIAQRRERAQELSRRLVEVARHRLVERRQRLAVLEARLRLLSPANVLARGYSITLDAASGAVLREAARVQPGQVLRTRLQEGEVRSVAQ